MAADGESTLLSVPPCSPRLAPVAGRLACGCTLLLCRSPAPDLNSACRAHRGRPQKGTVWDTDEWHKHDAAICKANTAF